MKNQIRQITMDTSLPIAMWVLVCGVVGFAVTIREAEKTNSVNIAAMQTFLVSSQEDNKLTRKEITDLKVAAAENRALLEHISKRLDVIYQHVDRTK